MIRLLVLVLLALNLLYFSWARWIDRDNQQLTAAVSTQPTIPAATHAPAALTPCSTLGPFNDELQALQAKEKLEASGWEVRRRDTKESVHEGWWVHVDHADLDSQTRTVYALRLARIGEAFAMRDDPEFQVSAGIFSTKDRAENRAAQVRRLKLDAVVTERVREQSIVWLDAPGVARETLSDGRLAKAGISLDKLRVEACPGVAPAGPAADIIPAP
ncbi:MAG: hypothetical protein ABIQ86_01855 [Steroidobacteraceae bacterium]